MDLRSKLTLDGSDFSKTIQDAGKQVNDFQKKSEDTSKTINDMGKASSKTASELLKEMKSIEGLGRTTGNYRAQLAQITRQIQDLTINYRAMSDEMKNSEFGREVAAKIDELTKKAGEYKDAMLDAQMSVKALASDTAGWDATKQGIDVVSSALQTFVATGVLGKESTEKMVAVLAKLKAMEAATNAVIKIGNALQKQSALMMGVAKVQSLAFAKAKTLEAAATGKATAAQKIFNAVAKANPYVLLASALIAVGTALVAFARKSDEAKRKEEELQKATQKAKEKFDDFKTSLGSAVGDVLGKFKNLQREWSNLQTMADKKKWINDNAEAFKELGLKVDDVNGAEKVFVEQADDVIAALIAKAKAAATMQLYMKEYSKVVEAQIEADKKLADEEAKGIQKRFTSGSMTGSSVPKEWQEAGLDEKSGDIKFTWAGGQSGAGYWEMTQKGYDKYIAHVKAEGQKLVDEAMISVADYERMVNTAEKEAADRAKKIQELMKPKGNGSDGSNKTTYEVGSVADYEAQISALNKKLKEQKLTFKEIKEIQDEIYLLNIKKDLAANGGLIPQLKPKTTLLESKVKEPIIEAKAEIVDIDIDDNAVLEAEGDLIGAFGNIASSVKSIYSTWESFSESIEDSSPLETFVSGIEAVLSTLQSVVSTMETINKLGSLFEAIENASFLIEQKKTQEKMKQIGANATNAALEEKEAIAAATKAASEGASSASKIPVVGWVLALGAIAAIIAAIAQVKSSVSFAKGGIVPGTSFSGDNIAANLNSGEMVLTTQQQRNLFDLLNGGNGTSSRSKVEFVIKGQDLKGVLTNYDKKMTRI